MSQSPRVSVILPTYNRADLVRYAIASVLDQTYRDFELIVVDDGSTDDTPAVLGSFDDPRLRCFSQPNKGRSSARNFALHHARGDYIAFQDSDDLYLPTKLAKQVQFLDEHPDYAAVYTSASCIGDNGDSLNFVYRASVSGNIYPDIAFFQPVTITLPTVMVRRVVLDETGVFDEAMHRFEDTDLWRRIAKHHLFGAIDEVTCLVRTHSGNILGSQDPETLAAAVNQYVSKVMTEDSDIPPGILEAGARRLYKHYGFAMATDPRFAPAGKALSDKAALYFQPKVSIVIPVYNGADFLREAIDSAIRQTYPNIEIVVVNDGSNDDGATEAIALSYGKRIHYVRKPNGGVASALNRGIREMSGELFAWLSHDDLYSADKVASQVEFLAEQPDPFNCIVYGDYSVFTSSVENAALMRMPHVAPEDFRYFITEQNILHGCTLLVPKAAFDRSGLFDETLRTTQDYDLWFRLASRHRFVHLPAAGVFARGHEGQGTNRMKDIVLTECNELLGRFAGNLTPEELRRSSSKPAAVALLELAVNLGQRGFIGASRHTTRLAKDAIRNSIQELAELQAKEPDPRSAAAIEELKGVSQLVTALVAERAETLAAAVMAERAAYEARSRALADEIKQPAVVAPPVETEVAPTAFESPVPVALPIERPVTAVIKIKRLVRRAGRRLPESMKALARRLWHRLSVRYRTVA
ncbi:glycosyltransferase involved in cell wall biosynthesis [Bradyrhizobium diazoefficiens]|uniref:glycosyltransferase n=1 Tax=Bradyrhizobium TaxID=374 RepID=UPI001B8BE7D7|nr:glycosyltransferase [Bradyrhizobium diazoefficiens]MBR0866087.1 glycosyltransferase family 2 protein [Bradyrhizobium diazoefficiens]MBR0890610.1 glycosyltransferase family 2 protein [Bradyrhizobium diazoefficiens]MBR0922379.1 glycosyltransferase family 2 protein [Bradyrhizobium diazoefficiens]